MKKTHLSYFVIAKYNLILLSLLIVSFTSFAQNKQPFVIPTLQQWEGATGEFLLPNKVQIIFSEKTPESFKKYANNFLNDLKSLDNKFEGNIVSGKVKKGIIYFDISDEYKDLSKEAYRLNIDDNLSIKASTEIGAFWATRTILQILEQNATHNYLPKGKIYDYPKYAVRGFMLDVGRKFFTIDFLRDYVKFMSYYKMNDFHIHLNDNGFKQFYNGRWEDTYSAFRLENETYPNLTAKDGSYSKKEFIELQKLAQGYAVNIIPEIDVPAHSLSISKAIPEIGSVKHGIDHLDINNPLTYTVLDNIFKEYLNKENPVFLGDVVHIGTDEYSKAEAEKFRYFTDYYIKYIQSFGKKPRLWGSLTHAAGKTPVKVEGVEMNAWSNGYANPKDMMALGYPLISTPDGWLYIVPAAGYYYDYLNNKMLYEKWTPNNINNVIFDENNEMILGGTFAVWNDQCGNGISEKDVHDRVFKSMQVLSQKMWTAQKTQLSFDEFSKNATLLGEAPSLNIAAKHSGIDNLVLSYIFNKKSIKDISGNKRNPNKSSGLKLVNKSLNFNSNSYIQNSINEIGYNYTVNFKINPSSNNKDNAILFSSENAIVKLKQGKTGKLGFSRDGYDYEFNFVVPENSWSNITIIGNNKGTSLYVNGAFVEKLEGARQSFPNTKETIAKIQTLVFPLQYIGDSQNGFKGQMSELKVYNRILSDDEIKKL